jgi:hypothetical protein
MKQKKHLPRTENLSHVQQDKNQEKLNFSHLLNLISTKSDEDTDEDT